MSLSFVENASLWNNGIHDCRKMADATCPLVTVYAGTVYECSSQAEALKRLIKCRKKGVKKVYRRGRSVRESRDRRRYS